MVMHEKLLCNIKAYTVNASRMGGMAGVMVS